MENLLEKPATMIQFVVNAGIIEWRIEEKMQRKKKENINFEWLKKIYQAGKTYLIDNFALMEQKIGEKIRDGKKRFKEKRE